MAGDKSCWIPRAQVTSPALYWYPIAVVTANSVEQYRGDIWGAIAYEADNLDHALALAKRPPGLKYGFAHEVFPEISLSQATHEKVSDQA